MHLASSKHTLFKIPVCVASAELCLLGQNKNFPFWDLLIFGYRGGRLFSSHSLKDLITETYKVLSQQRWGAKRSITACGGWGNLSSIVEDIERKEIEHACPRENAWLASILCKSTWRISRKRGSSTNRKLRDEYVAGYIKSFISRNKSHLSQIVSLPEQ